MTTETMPAPAELGEIEIGLTFAQARAVVDEIAALYAHANHDGKKRMNVLNVLSNTLIRELADKTDQWETNP